MKGKNKSTILIILIIVVVFLLLCGCIGGVITFLFIGNNNKLEDIPESVNDFMNSSDFDSLKEKGLQIYTGTNPPDVEGKYDTGDWVISYDQTNYYEVGDIMNSGYFTFSNQDLDGNINVVYEDNYNNLSATEAYISGDNGCFSIFMFLLSEDECQSENVEIISGCKETDGISNFQDAFYIKSYNETPECKEGIMDTNQVRILVRDTVVEKVE